MNKQEIMDAISAIKSNYPPEQYTMLRKRLDLAIEALTAQLTNGWIPVDSRMPDHLAEVIGCDIYGNREKVVFFDNMGKWKLYPGFSIEMDVIAWQPLPEPIQSPTDVDIHQTPTL